MAYRVWSHNGMIIYTEKCCMVPLCFEAIVKNEKFCKKHMDFHPIELSERDKQMVLEHQELEKSMIEYFSSRLRLPKELCQIDDQSKLGVSHVVGLIKKV